ncbi:hypothetical protein PSAR109036_01220 [Psychrobacter arenosus]|uniref:hypothetical protein n=1 Tax=Psychrobacter arenosus TaxID=256326 RepID=UPI001D11B9AC|nr:hypothetical protein [Psychrobacter arenosus]
MKNLSFATIFHPHQSARLVLSTALLLSVGLLAGCQEAKQTDSQDVAGTEQTDKAAAASESPHAELDNDMTAGAENDHEMAPGTLEKPYEINWSEVANGTAPVAAEQFQYPFAADSQQVTAYMTFFKVDALTAQHNLTIGMASNEALTQVLDQLGTRYVSHELTDGENIQMIVHTTPEIAPSRHDYVFADDFAKGLTLPIVIQPDASKTSAD